MNKGLFAVLFVLSACGAAMPIRDELPGWGRDGHDITAAIAQQLLTDSASQECATLLPSNNGQLIQIANWADEVKSKPAYKWSAPLHFINTPDWNCTYIRSRDCILNGVKNFCVDGAIQNYTKRVVDSSIGLAQQAEALKFLVHFVGDIHQPLHVAFTSDKGGNTITGTFEGASTNLHSVWDTAIIVKRMTDDFGGSQTAFMDYIYSQITGPWSGQAEQWVKCADSNPIGACSDEWAVESIEDACAYSYVEADGKTHIESGFDLEDPYYARNMPIIEMQLAKAGVRMAHVVNSLFTSAADW